MDYRIRPGGEKWETITEPVQLIRAPCHYGGTRPYFYCPGVINGRLCRRRVGKLFLDGRYFLCRHCYNVAYASQSEARYDRMLRRANKLRMALGGEPGTAQWIAPKPKGQWQKTYARTRCEIEWCEYQADRLFIAKFRHLLSPHEMKAFFGE